MCSVRVSVDSPHFLLLACLGHLCASGMSIIMLPCALLVTETTPIVPVGPPYDILTCICHTALYMTCTARCRDGTFRSIRHSYWLKKSNRTLRFLSAAVI